jgi:deazaflavin-dependent oxidoreductase (nitroreductase family)
MASNPNPTDSIRSAGTPPPRWLVKAMTRTHVFLHRLSGGHLFNKLAGDDVCFVTMKGAKSGRMLTIPLMYVPYQKGVLLVASLGGAPKNPAWYGNLVTHPDIEVNHRGHQMRLRARLATPDEKPALWPVCDRCYAPYAEYRKRTARDIPIFVCEPAV